MSSKKDRTRSHVEMSTRSAPAIEEKDPELEGDHRAQISVKVGDRDHNAQFRFPDNIITTAKYKWWNFLPINLFEQFRRIANMYFLLIIILCSIPAIAPFNIWSTILPLVLIVAATAAKDWIEDKKRKKQDKHYNSINVYRMREDGELEECTSASLQVGDVIRINEDDEIPADCIVLKAKEGSDGTCRMNTSTLDGENAPKVRKGLPRTHEMSEKELGAIFGKAVVTCKENDKQLHGFTGQIKYPDEDEPRPIGDENFLFRAATLSPPSQYCYAMIMFVGRDTTLMLNRNAVPYKFSKFEKSLNYCIIFLLAFNLSLCILLSLMASGGPINPEIFMQLKENNQFWLDLGTWYILFSFMIPISLYVTVEVVKIFEALFMQHDMDSSIWETELVKKKGNEHSDEEKDDEKEPTKRKSRLGSLSLPGRRKKRKHTMYKAGKMIPVRKGIQVRSSALNEELGQVRYIFSDKTGTLTQNKMELSKLSIESRRFKHDLGTAGVNIKQAGFTNLSEAVREMWKGYRASRKLPMESKLWHLIVNLVVCSETLYLKVQGSKIGRYVSPSPDEVSFAEALDLIGIKFEERDAQNRCQVRFVAQQLCPDDPEAKDIVLVFKTLAMLEFQSKRLRMTVVAEDPEGNIIVYTKGADQKMLPDPIKKTPGFCGGGQDDLIATTQAHIDEFAREGSRTLVMTYKLINKQVFEAFDREYRAASSAIENRKNQIEASFIPLEAEMDLIGATAVEDQMQEKVAETVEAFKQAQVKVMMLTGDKKETAVTIGKQSGIISDGAMTVFIDPPDPAQGVKSVGDQYKDVLETLKANEASAKPKIAALVLSGEQLEDSIDNHSDAFGEVFDMVLSIVCNRAAPAQKALVVKWCMTTHPDGVSLAIGDGANDVSMIQASNVGVGIMGKEGTQAALASDFIIYRFMHLKKLLFVHGRWNFLRTARVVLFCIYKNLSCILPLAWYGVFSGSTGQTIFEAFILANFNVIYTSAPPIVVGLFEKDAPADALLHYPEAYLDFGRVHPVFNLRIFISWCMEAVLNSAVYYFSVHLVLWYNEDVWVSSGKPGGLFAFGTILLTYEIVGINMRLLTLCRHKNIFHFGGCFIGPISYIVVWGMYQEVCWYGWDACGVMTQLLSAPFFYLALIPFVTLATAPGMFWDYMRRRKDPDLGDVLNEASLLGYLKEERHSNFGPSVFEFRPLRDVIKAYKTRFTSEGKAEAALHAKGS